MPIAPPSIPPHVAERRRERAVLLGQLGFSTYGEYLRSPHWVHLRRAYRNSDMPQDCVCGETDVHLHHLTYERIGAEMLIDLTPLCARCHSLVHVLEWRGQVGLDLGKLHDEERALAGREWLRSEVAAREIEAAQRLADEKTLVLSLSFAARLMRARSVLKARHIDASHRVHALAGMVKRGASSAALTRNLRRIESLAYGWDDWN